MRAPRCAWLLLAAGCGLGGGGVTPIHTPFNRGVYEYASGRYDAAINEYQRAVDDDPDDDQARFNLAVALEARAGQPDTEAALAARLRERARGEYRALLRRSPRHERAIVNLAALERGADPAAAERRLRALIATEPDRALPHRALAVLLLDAGREQDAAAELEVAHDLEPTSAATNLLRGDLLRRRGERAAARAAYLQVLAAAPGHPAALRALAALDLAEGHPAAAAPRLEQVLLADPDDYEAHRLMAEVAEANGDLEQAVWHLWQVRRLRYQSPHPASVGKRLAALYERLLQREHERSP